MTELQFWQSFWFLVIGAALFLFLWLDGFDLGIGMTLPFLKTPEHRLTVLNVIWPVWDGNELYGLIGGGAIFATFPVVFAALLSGLYPWVVLLLLGIMLRPVAFEAWNQEPKNKAVWEWLFALCSFLIPFVAGVALGTTVAGMPINKDMVWDHGHGFWEALSPLSVLTGLAVVALTLLQGSSYIIKKTKGALADQARKDLTFRVIFAAAALVLALLAALVTLPELWSKPLAAAGIIVGLILILGGLAGVWLNRTQGSEAAPFWFSSAVIAGTMILVGGIQFPTMIRSTLDPDFTLTIFKDGVSNPLNSLQLIGILAAIALAVTAVYTILVYRIFKGKTDHKTHLHY
jgi:cytochrome d ubiquinol oxidase subunit II